jgi:TonB-dependent siderophore receptor
MRCSRLALVPLLTGCLAVRSQTPSELPTYIVKDAEPSVAGSAAILGGSLLGAPVSSTVIPQSLIREQHQITLRDAVENSAGVVSGTGNGVHDFFVVRGIDSLTGSAVLIDGVPEPEATFHHLYNIREVHVLKGPGAFFFGGNSLAGSVNLLREQPSPAPQSALALGLEAGSFGTFGQELDWSSPNLRLNQFYRRSDGFRDGMDFEAWAVNPSLLWGDEKGRLTLQIDVASVEATPDAGIPTLGDRILPVGRKANFQDADEFSEQDIFRAVLSYEASLGQAWLRSKTYYTDFEWQSKGSVFAGFVPFFMGLEAQPATLARYKPELDDQQRILGTELEILKDVQAGRVTHHLLGGAEATRFTDEYTLATNPGESLHLGSGQRLPPMLPPLPAVAGDATSDVFSLYAADRLEIAGFGSLVLGGRHDWLQFEDDRQRTSRDDDEFSPFAGLAIDLNPQWVFFANAGEGFAPPSTLTQGPRRAPETSQQVEAGFKLASADRRWHGQLAAFQIERKDIAIPDATGILRQNGDQESEGVELEVAGQLTESTKVLAQAAWLDSELTRYAEYQGQQVAPYDGATAPFAPETLARLWLRQELGGGLAVGAGVRYTGEQFIHPDNRLELEATTVVDAAVYYTRANWELALNVENLTDETYYGRGVSSTSVRPEDGLGVFGTLRVRWD